MCSKNIVNGNLYCIQKDIPEYWVIYHLRVLFIVTTVITSDLLQCLLVALTAAANQTRKVSSYWAAYCIMFDSHTVPSIYIYIYTYTQDFSHLCYYKHVWIGRKYKCHYVEYLEIFYSFCPFWYKFQICWLHFGHKLVRYLTYLEFECNQGKNIGHCI